MRSYLIVANQTLTSRSLTDAITARLAQGPMRTYVVVPLSPVGGRLTWDEQASRKVAQTSLDEVLAKLREMGAESDGEVGDRDPVMAVRDALRGREVDEVIVSTSRRACHVGSVRTSQAGCGTRSMYRSRS